MDEATADPGSDIGREVREATADVGEVTVDDLQRFSERFADLAEPT